MSNENKTIQVLKERLTLRMTIISLVLTLFGLFIIFGVRFEDPFVNSGFNSLGGALITTGLFSVLWDLYGRRALIDEVLEKSNISQDLYQSGIRKIYLSTDNVQKYWDDFFKSSSKIDIFFRYGQTWRNIQRANLENFVKKNNSKIRLILPNPENEDCMHELERRLGKTKDEIKGKINNTVQLFTDLKSKAGQTSEVNILFSDETPLTSYYIFDTGCIWSTYAHGKIKTSVPSFISNNEGYIYKFFVDDFDRLYDQIGS